MTGHVTSNRRTRSEDENENSPSRASPSENNDSDMILMIWCLRSVKTLMFTKFLEVHLSRALPEVGK